MGVTIAPRRGWTWLRSDAGLRTTSVASIVANVLIVITGGAVRLTASGLGCPTWPRCTDGSLVRTSATVWHGAIEFTNRTLTFALLVVAVATLLAALGQRRQVRLAALALAGIPAQAVPRRHQRADPPEPMGRLGHLLLSMTIIAVTVRLWWRVRHEPGPARTGRPGSALVLARLVVVVTAVVLAAGTVVTGSGPHAGTADTDGRVHRNGLHPAAAAQLHADLVMVLIGLSAGLVLLLRALRSERPVYRCAAALVAVELAQGVIGYVQYFLHVPAALVGVHMAGACVRLGGRAGRTAARRGLRAVGRPRG